MVKNDKEYMRNYQKERRARLKAQDAENKSLQVKEVKNDVKIVKEEKADPKVLQVQEEKKELNHLMNNFGTIREGYDKPIYTNETSEFSDGFIVAWDVLKISVDSMFKSSKWRSMNALWKIVKAEIEAKR